MKDFFVSYNTNDRRWAEWIAWQLEEHGFSVTIQAWDFVGNWIITMDQAMRDSQRTVAVLSPYYLEAKFTQSEWANAFRLDPTGEKNLLIPVRVAPVELSGILAEIVYVDLVGRSEEEARDLLLKRVRGERGKPLTSPKFPSDQHSRQGVADRSIAQKPVFPAAAEDKEKLRTVRDIVVRWRGQYIGKVDSLHIASERARAWSRQPPTQLDDDVVQVITLAAYAARDLRALPLDALEYARAYGLMIHPTVFWGQAISDVLIQASVLAPKTRRAVELKNESRKKQGLPALGVPNNYGFEMLARILEAALALARFNIGALPRGYLDNTGQAVSGDLGAYSSLLIVSVDNDHGLHAMAVNAGIERIGSFVARKLALRALCAQRNQEGSLDLVAEDGQHLYYWQMSSQLPTMEFPIRGLILDARMLSSAPGAVATVDASGAVTIMTPEGRQEIVMVRKPPKAEIWVAARIWIDPLEEKAWYVVTWNPKNEIISGLHGSVSASRSAEDLWNDPVFLTQFDGIDYLFWDDWGSLTLGTVDNLPCLIVRRQAYWGSGVCFLDPKTLVPIRRPIAIREFVGDMTIAAERWLVVALLSKGEVRNRIMVWDLNADNEEPVGSWLEERGDVYDPIVVMENSDSFQTVQVLHSFRLPSGENYQLCRFHWPSGNIEVLKRFANVEIWPVINTPDSKCIPFG